MCIDKTRLIVHLMRKDWFPEIDPKDLKPEDFAQPIIEPPRLPVPKEVFPNAERVLADWLAPNRSDSND
jgi:hypothetical protein